MSKKTIEIHHDEIQENIAHLAREYVGHLGELHSKSIEEMIVYLSQSQQFEHATQTLAELVNHSLFWTFMSPHHGGQMPERLSKAVARSFGSTRAFKKAFSAAAMRQPGSGWICLIEHPDGTLSVARTGYLSAMCLQESPAILGCDVSEHSYFLDYGNDREQYINNWLNNIADYRNSESKLRFQP